MILLKIVDVRDKPKNGFIYFDEIKKIKSYKDRQLAIASKQLKNGVERKFFSISHSWPFCILVESDKKIGIDIENMWRKINYSKIYRKKINPNSCYISREGFFKEWTMREAYYKFSQDVNYLKANIQDIRSLNWTICVIEERFIISVCTSDEYVDEIMWKYIKVDQRTD